MNPLIDKGLGGNLKSIDDLFDLPESLSLHNTAERLHNAVTQTVSLFKALHRVFGYEFYLIGLLRFICDMFGFSQPLLLAALLNNTGENKTGSDWRAYAFAASLFATTLLGKLAISFYIKRTIFFFKCFVHF